LKGVVFFAKKPEFELVSPNSLEYLVSSRHSSQSAESVRPRRCTWFCHFNL